VHLVIFACVHNAGRSQMAAAWFNALSDPSRARALSAGTAPGPRVHPEVQQAMGEVGVDLSGQTPQQLTDELAAGASLLVTMGCGEACPAVPGLAREDWPLEDRRTGRSSGCGRSATRSGDGCRRCSPPGVGRAPRGRDEIRDLVVLACGVGLGPALFP